MDESSKNSISIIQSKALDAKPLTGGYIFQMKVSMYPVFFGHDKYIMFFFLALSYGNEKKKSRLAWKISIGQSKADHQT